MLPTYLKFDVKQELKVKSFLCGFTSKTTFLKADKLDSFSCIFVTIQKYKTVINFFKCLKARNHAKTHSPSLMYNIKTKIEKSFRWSNEQNIQFKSNQTNQFYQRKYKKQVLNFKCFKLEITFCFTYLKFDIQLELKLKTILEGLTNKTEANKVSGLIHFQSQLKKPAKTCLTL